MIQNHTNAIRQRVQPIIITGEKAVTTTKHAYQEAQTQLAKRADGGTPGSGSELARHLVGGLR